MRSFLSMCICVFAFLFLATLSAQACSCNSPGLPCQAYWNTSAVFSGEVSDVSSYPTKYLKSPDGTTYYMMPPKKVRFNVDEIFRGISVKTVEIKTGASGCKYWLSNRRFWDRGKRKLDISAP